MQLLVCAVGRLKAGPERELALRYAARCADLGRPLGLAGPRILEVPEDRSRDARTRRRQEWQALAARSEGAVRIILDERGTAPTSAQFAGSLVRRRDAGAATLAYLVGGADGLDEAARSNSDEIIAFGAMTLPHHLVRIVLLEQIYRAMTILAGHPYHRA